MSSLDFVTSARRLWLVALVTVLAVGSAGCGAPDDADGVVEAPILEHEATAALQLAVDTVRTRGGRAACAQASAAPELCEGLREALNPPSDDPKVVRFARLRYEETRGAEAILEVEWGPPPKTSRRRLYVIRDDRQAARLRVALWWSRYAGVDCQGSCEEEPPVTTRDAVVPASLASPSRGSAAALVRVAKPNAPPEDNVRANNDSRDFATAAEF